MAEPACAAPVCTVRSPCSQRATPTSRAVSERRAGVSCNGGRGELGDLLGALRGEAPDSKPERHDGDLLTPGEGDRRRNGIGGGQRTRRLHLVAVGDHRAARQIAEAARVVAQQDADRAERVEERQRVDHPQEVPDQATRRRDRQAVGHQHHEAQYAFAGRGGGRGQLEDHGVEPVQDEQKDIEDAAAEFAAGGERRAQRHQKHHADRRIDQEGRRAHRETSGAYRDCDAFRGLRRENRVDRWIQARMTMVSAM